MERILQLYLCLEKKKTSAKSDQVKRGLHKETTKRTINSILVPGWNNTKCVKVQEGWIFMQGIIPHLYSCSFITLPDCGKRYCTSAIILTATWITQTQRNGKSPLLSLKCNCFPSIQHISTIYSPADGLQLVSLTQIPT